MEFYRYLNVLKKHLLLIVFLTLLGAGSAYGFSKRQHKVYSATATLSINAAAPATIIPFLANAVSGSGVAPVDQLANTYSVFLKSRSFDQMIVNKLRLGVAPEALAAHISSALIPNTNYFQISVTWGDPVQAATIANGIANAFVNENKARQEATQGAQTNSLLNQSLTYFRNQILRLQKQYDALVRNPRSSLTRVNAVSDRLNTVSDEYYRLVGTAGANVQQASTNTAAPQDAAIPSGVPISPHVSSNTFFGLLVGLFLGLGLAFLLDYLDYSLRTPEDVEQSVGQAPLGIVGEIGVDSPAQRRLPFGRKKPTPAAMTVPAINSNGKGKIGVAPASLAPLTVINPQLVTLNHPKAPITEAFRTLRTNLDFSALDKPLKSLVITSSVPAEGKSTIAANLAVAEAQAGKRVILVDADLRRPSLGKIFGLKPATGFTTVLLNRENRARAIDEALQSTVVPNLFVMTSGPHPPNPAELLASQSATEVLRELEERADLVIFDTPPMGPLTDAVVLSARVDGTMIVMRAGSTRRTLVSNSVNTIKKVGGNVVGTVLNMVDLKGISSYSYYYYYSTEYYGREETPPTIGTRR
jgi:capsular exopolysaccharide synthesis family protein